VLKIIYYSDLGDAIRHGEGLRRDGFDCFLDQPGVENSFRSFPSLDSDVTEEAIGFLFDRFGKANELESTIIHAQIFSQYPRLFRCSWAFRESGNEKVAFFIRREALCVYDLAFSSMDACEFEYLENTSTSLARLHDLVEFYHKPDSSPIARPVSSVGGKRGSGLLARFAPVLRRKFERRQKRVLFLANDNEINLYLRPMVSVFRELERKGVPFEIVGCDARATGFLRTEGVRHVEAADFVREHSVAEVEEARADAERWFMDALAGIETTGDRLYDELMLCAMNSAVRRDVVEGRLFSNSVAEYVKKNQVTDVFFIPDGTPVAAGVHIQLKGLNVRMHSLVAAGVSRFRRGVGYYFADTIYCAGGDAKGCVEYHFPDRRVLAVGSPVPNRYLSMGAADFPPGRSVILIATSGFDEEEVGWIASFVSRLDPKHYLVVLKPHPSYRDRYVGLAECLEDHLLAPFDFPIEKLVNSADVVVTDHSQVGVDAHLLGKPVVSMYQGRQDILYMRGIESIRYVRSVDELVEAVSSGHRSVPVSKAFVDAFNAGGDQYYFKRIVNFIAKN